MELGGGPAGACWGEQGTGEHVTSLPRKMFYGANKIDVEVPSLAHLLIKEVGLGG